MKTIDPKNWPRTSHYQLFRNVAQPHFSLTAPVEVTPLMEVYKAHGLSVFSTALYAIMAAANNIEQFRTRFRDNIIVQHDVVHASTTVPLKNDRFGFCEVPFNNNYALFADECSKQVKKAEQQSDLKDNIVGQDNWIYLSCLPWLSFTAMNNPLNGPDDCIPRMVWGKISKSHNRWHMPVGIEAHHALVDGLHMAKLFQGIEDVLGDVKNFLP